MPADACLLLDLATISLSWPSTFEALDYLARGMVSHLLVALKIDDDVRMNLETMSY